MDRWLSAGVVSRFIDNTCGGQLSQYLLLNSFSSSRGYLLVCWEARLLNSGFAWLQYLAWWRSWLAVFFLTSFSHDVIQCFSMTD